MKTFNVTLSNNTCLQITANSTEEVLEAFKMEVTGIMCNDITQCTSANSCLEKIKFKDINRFEICCNDTIKTFVTGCSSAHSYPLESFASRMGYTENQAAELISVVEKIFDISPAIIVVKTYNENYLSVKVNGMTLVDSCLLRLMKKVLKLVTSQNAL